MKLSEVKIQAQIFQYHWNTYPDERGLLCYNLNNSANKVQGSQNKAIGLIKGRSDMVYYFNGKATMIELKNETGKQSKDQLLWQATIEKAGFTYLIMRSLQDFIDFKESLKC